jgi:serine/threonine protein phosphatase PrpC
VAGRASIVGAAETSVGKVRDHNEDSHFIDPEAGIFVVCDGMGGHAAGEVASALAVQKVRQTWASDGTQKVCDRWLSQGTPEARKQLLQTVQAGVLAAHEAIVAEAELDKSKKGMGTTLVGAMVVGGDVVFAHAGDSRAYIVRDGIAMQLTEDHTLLARLLAAGVDVDVDGEGMRFKSMLTNALGIGHECKVSTFVVPLADGDRFLLCSDGITEYVKEAEIGEVLTTQPSPARSAQRLVEIALQRGGGDNATALVVRVLEAGENPRPASDMKREEQAVNMCPIWGKANPQQRLRALRIALPRDYPAGEKLPAQTLGDRVAWIVVEGELEQDGLLRGPGALMYPEALLTDRPLPDKDGLAITQSEFRGLALRSDDFRELCDDDPELGEILLGSLAAEIAARRPKGRMVVDAGAFDGRGSTDPGDDVGRLDTDQLPAVKDDSEIARARTDQMAAVKPAHVDNELARRDTGKMPVLKETSESDVSVEPATEPALPTGKRQPKGSTIPPANARPKSNTDVGASKPDRAPGPPSIPPPMGTRAPTPPPLPPVPPAPQRIHPRGSTPPTGFFVPPEETANELDRALGEITGERLPPPPAHENRNEESLLEIVVEAEPPPSPTAPTLRPPSPVPSPPPATAKSPHLSEPEIQIEELAAAAELPDVPAARPSNGQHDDDEPAVEMIMTVEDDSAKTITLTADEPSSPEITIEPLVAAEDDPKPIRRAKSET